MCGIVGYFSTYGDFNARQFATANNMVKYRGPDDYGYVTVDRQFNVYNWHAEDLRDYRVTTKSVGALGFRRLSIIDLTSAGHQPMCDESKNYYIVHNGEVYNYLELRQELEARGYEFRSNTDTEVVLKAYKEWGSDCINKFNGMWSFCILDIENKKLFCCRDRLGIKPFYYYVDRDMFIFGSEVKQVISLLPFKAEANEHILFDYLALGSYGNETRETFFREILKLLPGEFLTVNLGQSEEINVRSEFWWDLPTSNSIGANEKIMYGAIRSLLEDSIRLRLRSDVPLGTCLSGGLDSSGIVCLVDNIIDKTHTTYRHKVFVIGSSDPEIDETKYAKTVINRTCVDAFFKYPDSIDLEKDLETLIWHHDEPLITASMFGGWHVYKLAKEKGVTVVLDGQGADELLGGYYFGAHVDYLRELMNNGQIAAFLGEFKSNVALHNVGEMTLLKRMVLSNIKRSVRGFVPSRFRPMIYRKTKGWLKKEFVRANIPKSHVLTRDYWPVSRKFSSVIKEHSYEFAKFTSLPGILRQVDRNSMAFSVEARVPFLDHRLVEYLFGLPTRYVLRNGYTKYAYREAMKGILPERIRLRTDKKGFAMPDRELLAGAMPFVKSIIDRIPTASAIYEKDAIANRIEATVENANSYEPIVWRIINGVIWQNNFGIGKALH